MQSRWDGYALALGGTLIGTIVEVVVIDLESVFSGVIRNELGITWSSGRYTVASVTPFSVTGLTSKPDDPIKY